MQTPIDQMEVMVENGAKALFDSVQLVMDSLGDRPFMSSKMTSRQELDAYQALRLTQDGLYHYADGIRVELDSRLAQYSSEERIALGVSDSEIRHVAYLLTLKYVQRMTKLSEKLGVPIEGLELVPEPLPPADVNLGGEEWQAPMETTTLMEPTAPFPPPPSMISSSIPSIQAEPSLPAQPLPQPLQSPSPIAPTFPTLG